MNRPFHLLPENGNFSPGRVIISLLLLISVFVGIGQIPLVIALFDSALEQSVLGGLTQSKMAELLGSNMFLTLLLVPFALGLLAILFSIKYIHKSEILPFFTSRTKFDWQRVILSLGIWGVFMLFMTAYSYFTSDTLIWNYNSSTFWMLLFICLFILPLQTTCEELLFRSYLFKNLNFIPQPLIRIIICGTLFGLMHAANPEVEILGKMALVFYVWNGIFLGLLTHYDNGMELSLGYHAINNIFAALIITNNWQALQTDALLMDTSSPVLGWEIGLTMFVWQPILFFFFKWKYNWTWKQKTLEEM
jgi:membrane protease YdiL (CAAX protease family)